MRKVKMILCWIGISLILQCTVLFFLDKFYFKDDTNVNMQKVSINSTKDNNERHVDIPNNAKDIKISYDGKYISYYNKLKLNICNSNTGDTNELENPNNNQILRSVWLADRNMLLTLEVEDGEIVLYNYEPEKGVNQKIIGICPYNQMYKNFDIKASTITGVTYIKINNHIYRVDINQTFATRVPLNVRVLGDISIIPTKDRLVYMAPNGTILHMTQPNTRLAIRSNESLVILGIDEDSVVYLGEVRENKINKIVRKNLNDIYSKEKIINLDEPVNKKDIFIDGRGNIYINSSSKKIVRELNSKKETNYKGEFLGFYNNGVASLVEGKYYKTPFKK